MRVPECSFMLSRPLPTIRAQLFHRSGRKSDRRIFATVVMVGRLGGCKQIVQLCTFPAPLGWLVPVTASRLRKTDRYAAHRCISPLCRCVRWHRARSRPGASPSGMNMEFLDVGFLPLLTASAWTGRLGHQDLGRGFRGARGEYSRDHEQRPVRRPLRAGEAAVIQLNRLQHLAAVADGHSACPGRPRARPGLRRSGRSRRWAYCSQVILTAPPGACSAPAAVARQHCRERLARGSRSLWLGHVRHRPFPRPGEPRTSRIRHAPAVASAAGERPGRNRTCPIRA